MNCLWDMVFDSMCLKLKKTSELSQESYGVALALSLIRFVTLNIKLSSVFL